MSANVTIKRALLSVSDKSNLDILADRLSSLGVELISSGGTGKFLSEHGYKWTPVEEVTGNPEAFNGRMKTLSFQISSALLFKRDCTFDVKQAKELGINAIDLVVCNLYPFVETAKETNELDDLIEKIDIGGPTMVRASAKNFKDVLVCVDPGDYELICCELEEYKGATTLELRKSMALKAFKHTASYDSAISQTLDSLMDEAICDRDILIPTSEGEELRYGENPHQWAKVIKNPLKEEGLAWCIPVQGKKLSYNNFLDADAAYRCTSDLHNLFSDKYIVTVIKHANPCGVSVDTNGLSALAHAWASDPISAFGSIICFNKEVDEQCAEFFNDKFIEVILAPSFSDIALEIFSKKKNLRLLTLAPCASFTSSPMIRSISGGWVVQEEDSYFDVEFQIVTQDKSVADNEELLKFGSVVTKHLKSNAISLIKKNTDGLSLAGAGMGNPNRLVSTQQAIAKVEENGFDLKECVLISDAFFPFRDNVELAAAHGITKIVQPGGSIRDEDVITACNEHSVSMCFTGHRHFRH